VSIHDDDDLELSDDEKAELDRRLEEFLAGLIADDSSYLAHIASRVMADRDPTSWHPVDLAAALEEARTGTESPGLLRRTDGRYLLYEGRTHSLAGEPESGKSWLALLLASQAITEGLRVLWVDYEDTASGILGRLDALAIPEATILGGLFAYVRPEEPIAEKSGRGTPAIFDFEEVLRTRWDVVVLDGVTEAMVVEGFDPLSNADAAAWSRRIVKRFSSEGAAVLLLDHLSKPNPESGHGRYAIGAQHKLAGLTGAGFRLDSVEPFRRAGSEPVDGLARIVVTKDRPGHVRGIAVDSVVAVLKFTSWPDGRVSLVLDAPNPHSPDDVGPLDRRLVKSIVEFLLAYDGSTGRAITTGIPGGNAEKIRETLRRMAELGLLRIEKMGPGHYHFLTDAGRAWIEEPPDSDGGPGGDEPPRDDPDF